MEFGIGLTNYRGCWDDAAFAEQHGFSTVGFIDSPLISGDPFTAMALTAQATSTMRIGSYLNVPSLRSAPATAAAISSINELAPGRVYFGTGTGYTGRQTFGLKSIPLSHVTQYIREIRGLLAGEEVMHRHGSHETAIRMVNKAQIANNRENPIPIYLAADGPRGLALTGQEADGWLTTLHFDPAMTGTMMNAPEVFTRSYTAVQEASSAAGRDFSDAHTSWSTSICVLEPGEPVLSPRSLRQVGPMGMFAFHTYACSPEIRDFLSPTMRDRVDIYEKEVLSRLDLPRDRLYQAVHEGHLTHLIDGEAAVLTEDILRVMSLTGTASEIAAQLQRLEAAGLRNVTLTVPPGCVREVVLDVAERIMPLMGVKDGSSGSRVA